MAPTCSRAAIRVLVTILLASSVANAAALPHELLDPRTPLSQENEALAQALATDDDAPQNFWEAIGKLLNNNSGWDIFRDFWARLFNTRDDDDDSDNDGGSNNDDDDDDQTTTTTTIYVTPTTSVPPSSEATSISSSEDDFLVSILPFGPLSTGVDLSPLESVIFTTVPETPLPSATEVLPPISANATTIDPDWPTAIPITDEFSVTIPIELQSSTAVPASLSVSLSANASAPIGTGAPLPWSGNGTSPVIEPSLLTGSIVPTSVSNETALNTTSTTLQLTSIVVVTATVTAIPDLGTGTAASGTGAPISDLGSVIWSNSSFVPPTILPGTGTGSPVGTSLPEVEIPIFPNTTASAINSTSEVTSVILLPVTVTGVPGAIVNVSVSVPLAPYANSTTYDILLPGTGYASPSVGTGVPIPISEIPIYTNTSSDAVVSATALPGTGSAAASVGTGLPIVFSEIPLYTNTTAGIVVSATLVLGTGSAAASAGTGLPIVISEIPLFTNTSADAVVSATVILGTGSAAASAGTGLPIVVSGIPLFTNTSSEAVATPTLLPGTGSAAPSAATELPIAVSETPIFANTTTTVTVIDVATDMPTSTLILPPPETSLEAVEFPGLLALRAICNDPQIRVVTLPLLNRFYGPNNYPALYSFPGCHAGNARQRVQAPGLLDCSTLGEEVQRCQSLGKKVLLSVRADGFAAVGGNAEFGDPESSSNPFGLSFAAEGGLEKNKRQTDSPALGPVEELLELLTPISETVSSSPLETSIVIVDPIIPLGPGPVILNGTTPSPPVSSIDETNVLPGIMTESPVAFIPLVAPPPTDTPFPNLFDMDHAPSALALTLFSLFGEGHTERADLRPLGPDVPSGASPENLNGTDWLNPILTVLQRPLGEEVIVDGFDVQIPAEWKGTYQDFQFRALVRSMRELNLEAWRESGGVTGGRNDLGVDGRSVVYFGWVGGALKVRSEGLEVSIDTDGERVGWKEWNPMV